MNLTHHVPKQALAVGHPELVRKAAEQRVQLRSDLPQIDRTAATSDPLHLLFKLDSVFSR